MGRKKNIYKNLFVNLFSHLTTYLFLFITQRYLVLYIGIEYVGLKSLLISIISLMSIVNVGMDIVITHSLYKPVLDSNENVITSIVSYFKKMYNIILLIILLLGIIITPFLSIIIKSPIELEANIKFCFWILIFGTSSNYLLGYKKVLLTAYQVDYINNLSILISSIIFFTIQIFVLVVYSNFYIYLVLFAFKQIFENTLINYFTNKKFSYIKNNNIVNISSIKKKINKNIKSMIYHQIGSVVITNSDSIIITLMIGLNALGKYNSYFLIISGLTTLLTITHNASIASFGNLISDNINNKKIYKYYSIFFYLSAIVASFTSICFYFLSPYFIRLWIGEEYIFNNNIVFLMSSTYYFTAMRKSNTVLKLSFGIFREDQFKAIIESLSNIILSIFLGFFYGIYGILLATLLSRIFIPGIIEPYVVHKYGFKKSPKDYFLKEIYYIFITFLIFILSYYFIKLISINSDILSFLIYGIIIGCVTLIVFCFFTMKTNEFKEVFEYLRNKLK